MCLLLHRLLHASSTTIRFLDVSNVALALHHDYDQETVVNSKRP